MKNLVFTKWLGRQGYKSIISNSGYWVVLEHNVLQSYPYYSIIAPSQNELLELLFSTNANAIRFSTYVENQEGKISYHVISENNKFTIETLPKKVRHDIQHGLEYCEYKRISMSTLAEQGWEVRKNTLARQGRESAETKHWWTNLCYSAEDLPGFEAWGAIKDNQLIASIFTHCENGTSSILYQQSLTDHLKHGINNTLTYVFINHILENDIAQNIFYGLHSLDAPPSVDEFKFRMGFTAKPVRQRVVFNPKIEPLFNPITYRAINALHNLIPGNPTLSKTEGMVRFYLEGKKPLSQQQWPDVLLSQKEEIIAQSIEK